MPCLHKALTLCDILIYRFMQKRRFLLCVFSLSIFISSAQLPNKKETRSTLDTNLIKNNILEFTRLSFSKSSPDSIIKFCGFPFYSKNWRSKKVYSSSAELKAELKRIFKKEKFKPVVYKTESIFKTDYCVNNHFKAKKIICFKMRIHMPYVGEGSAGSGLLGTFYIDTNFPYHILGMDEE